MRILGATATAGSAPARSVNRGNDRRDDRVDERPAPTVSPREERVPDAPVGDWREVLRATGSAPTRQPAPSREASPPPAAPPSQHAAHTPDASDDRNVRQASNEPEPVIPAPAAPAVPSADAPPGIVVGQVSRELFGSTLATVPTLPDLAEIIAKCTRCPLYKTATNPVPGEGSPTAELVCVGEAPGENEDKTGRPFVGPAGQLLTKILAAINLAARTCSSATCSSIGRRGIAIRCPRRSKHAVRTWCVNSRSFVQRSSSRSARSPLRRCSKRSSRSANSVAPCIATTAYRSW